MLVKNENRTAPFRAPGRPAVPRLDGDDGHDGHHGDDDDFVEGVLQLVAEKGYSALTSADVAKRAGVPTAVLHRRWPTKRSLFTHIARTVILDALGEIDTGTLRGDLRELVIREQRLFGRVGSALLTLMAEAPYDEELRELLHETVILDTGARSAAILRRAAARDEIPEPEPSTVRLLTVILVGGGFARDARPPAPPERGPDPGVESVLTFVLAALGQETEKVVEGG